MSLKPKALILSAGLALTLAAAASTAGGATPTRWIVFSASPQNGRVGSEIFRIRTNRSGLQQITAGRHVATEPSFAPNGKRVAFARLNAGIFVVNLDGSGLRRLTRGRDRYPVYSPDGRRIAFVHNGRLQVMRADGSGRRYFWRVPGPAGRPSWTPEGRSIAIPAGEDPYDDFLYTVATRSGRIERRLALGSELGAVFTRATLSPDGRMVAFIGRRPEPPGCQQDECEVFALYLKRASGGRSQHVTDDGGPVGWSSDSRTLVYAYSGALRLQPLRGGATKTIEIGSANVLEGQGPPALQPR